METFEIYENETEPSEIYTNLQSDDPTDMYEKMPTKREEKPLKRKHNNSEALNDILKSIRQYLISLFIVLCVVLVTVAVLIGLVYMQVNTNGKGMETLDIELEKRISRLEDSLNNKELVKDVQDLKNMIDSKFNTSISYLEQRLDDVTKEIIQSKTVTDVQAIQTSLDSSLKIAKRSADVLNLTMALLDKQNDTCLKNNVLMIRRVIAEFEVHSKAKDCKDLFDQGVETDGVYNFFPTEYTLFRAYCDMTNGGWTVIQRRENGNLSFDHNWEKYAEGFGDTDNDHWLGLRHLYYLTKNKPSQIHFRFLMKTTRTYATAVYDGFYTDNEAAKFRMHVQPNATYNSEMMKYVDDENLFYYHNNMKFSTKYQDNDASGSNCAKSAKGSFWYNKCWRLRPNAEFSEIDIWSSKTRPVSNYASRTEIKIRRM